VRGYLWLKISALALTVLAVLVVAFPAEGALAQGGPALEDRELAQTYAPVLYFHPDELYRPQPVEVMVDTARLRQARPLRIHVNVLTDVSPADLVEYSDSSYNLDAWLGDEGSSDYKNYSAHQAYYRATLRPESGGLPITAYAHVVRDEIPQHITIQYWLFYYYNDWFNKHEGDWEMLQVVLSAAGEPEWLILSQHHDGARRPWNAARIEEGTHPAVYVALGSHANYFCGDEIYPNSRTIGNTRVEIMDRTGSTGRTIPDFILIPDREQVEADLPAWQGLEWLLFCGGWGEVAPQSDFSGPRGPADKGDQWERTYAWGMAQPLDTDIWYANRLRVEVVGPAGTSAQVTLQATRTDLPSSAETLPGLALLHTDPDPNESFVADIEVTPGHIYDIVATWPDPEHSRVTRYHFEDVGLAAPGQASLSLAANQLPYLRVAGLADERRPRRIEMTAATWDAPDLVWMFGTLPALEVARGLALSLLAGLLPTLLYVGVFYWIDRYEKEPASLLAAAFVWGAVPALLVALAARLFFRLPADLLGPPAVEALRAGLLTPLIEEALKGAVVLFIAWRYRLEFDNVLDGIIYGAMVGIGFAMTGNTLSYLGAFLLYGFEGLSGTVFVDGVLYGLNHALYSAIFGAGLGYARLAQKRWQRWAIPVATFGLAVATHALHGAALRTTTGWNLLSLAMLWAGALVIGVAMVWSLRRQRRCLAAELVGEIPEVLRRTLIMPAARLRAQWRAFSQDGLPGLQRMRHIYQQCAELAFKKMQHRHRPDEPGLMEEVVRLRKEVGALVGDGGEGDLR
jgi:RsiW-degrading membrane proteinase PrsW (M82 family)